MDITDLFNTEFGVLVTTLVTAYAIFIACGAGLAVAHTLRAVSRGTV